MPMRPDCDKAMSKSGLARLTQYSAGIAPDTSRY
jgi:hypothetical protein